jgi:outer membrane protein TolC
MSRLTAPGGAGLARRREGGRVAAIFPASTFVSRARAKGYFMFSIRPLALILVGALLASAQMTSSVSGRQSDTNAPWLASGAWFRKTFFYRDVEVKLRDPIKLKDYVVDGKLTLSLRNYLDLVMANNTDVEIQRVQLEYSKNSIQRAFAVFDPVLNSSFSATRSKSFTTSALQGASVLSSLDQPFSTTVTDTLPTGTQVTAGVTAEKTSTNSTYYFYNPAYSTTMNFGFTQPLLRGRGAYVTKLPITIARRQRAAAQFSYRNSLLSLVSSAENAYWDVISARERLKVQRQALDLADKALKRSRQEVEVGATSPLEIFQPEQQYATSKLTVAQVEFQVRQTEDVLRRQLGVDLDPSTRALPIELTEQVSSEVNDAPIDRETLVQQALVNRPDLKNIQTGIEVNNLQIRNAVEALKPLLNLSASYTTTGSGGRYIPSTTAADGSTIFLPPVPGGITDAFGQMFGFSYPTWQFSLTLQLPLRDRAGAANLADAVVAKRINMLNQRTSEQQIRQDVLTAVTEVESSREGVKLAKIAVDFARKRVEADQKRYELGAITVFFLLSGQTDLATAESNLVSQIIQHRRDLLNLQQRLGTLLADRGIVVQ